MYIFINKKSPAKGIRPNGVPRPANNRLRESIGI